MLIRDGGEGGMEVGGEGDYISLANTGVCVTTRMIPALRWATMTAILMFQ